MSGADSTTDVTPTGRYEAHSLSLAATKNLAVLRAFVVKSASKIRHEDGKNHEAARGL